LLTSSMAASARTKMAIHADTISSLSQSLRALCGPARES
jgi:hypothetical protein